MRRTIERRFRYGISMVALVLLPITVQAQMKSIDFKQVLVGANGPRIPGAFFFERPSEIDNSWLKQALTQAQYERVLHQIDFRKQVLMALALGQRRSASGAIQIVRVARTAWEENPSMDVAARAGVLVGACAEQNVVSTPFVLAVIQKPKVFQPVAGYDIGSYRDACPTNVKQAATGTGVK